MKWQMSENSLFAILLRSQWWISAGVAAAVAGTAIALLPDAYKVLGATLGLPFLVIACIAAWRQWQLPSAARVQRTIEAVRAMSRSEFVAALEAAYARDGYTVTRIDDAHADLALKQEWRTALVSCKRWKVARLGVEPLRDLLAAKDARELREGIFVATGEVTDTARTFAAKHGIRVVGGAELARLLPDVGRGR
jgi:restriction system protein